MSNPAPLVHPALLPPGVKDDRQLAVIDILNDDLKAIDIASFVMTDAYTVDAKLLPYLVREFSLQEFITPGLPETAIRKFIANAYELHAKKGYIEGVRLGLSMLDVEVHWTQWWQPRVKAAHNTHKVSIYFNTVLFDDSALGDKQHRNAITRIIDATKRHSQFVDIRFGVQLPVTGYVGASARFKRRIHVLAVQPVPDFGIAAQTIGALTRVKTRVHIKAVGGISPGSILTNTGNPLATHDGRIIVREI